MDLIKILFDAGFPIASAVAAGYFVFLTVRYILAGVISGIKGIIEIGKRLDNRVSTMVSDVQRLDVMISHSLGLQPDYDRISRAERDDQRKD